MTRIVLDSELRQRLHGLRELIEICDEQGRLVGYVSPVTSIYDELEIPPITKEEVEEFRKNRTGRPLSAIIADLERRS